MKGPKFSARGNLLIALKMAEIESRRTGEAWVPLRENSRTENELLHSLGSRGRPTASLVSPGGCDLDVVDDDAQDLVSLID